MGKHCLRCEADRTLPDRSVWPCPGLPEPVTQGEQYGRSPVEALLHLQMKRKAEREAIAEVISNALQRLGESDSYRNMLVRDIRAGEFAPKDGGPEPDAGLLADAARHLDWLASRIADTHGKGDVDAELSRRYAARLRGEGKR